MRKSIKVFISNIRLWHRNPKVIIPFILALVCVFMLCQRISSFIRENDLYVNIFEVFIAIFNDQYSILLTSILVIIILFDAPNIEQSTPYYLIRSGSRHRWLSSSRHRLLRQKAGHGRTAETYSMIPTSRKDHLKK